MTFIPLVARCVTTSNERIDAESETFVAMVSPTLCAGGNSSGGDRFPGTTADSAEMLVAHTLRADGFDASEDGTGRGTPLGPVAYRAAADGAVYEEGDITAPLTTDTDRASNVVAIQKTRSTNSKQRGAGIGGDVAYTLDSKDDPGVFTGVGVRRLTPRECERLQGFPDDHTLIDVRGKPAADGPRYKAIGNSMAIPPMRWIGTRIQMWEDDTI